MKEMIVALCAILAVTTARVVINIEGQDTPHLLGAKACTWGPSYWCQNISTAAGCNATKHCIPKVWEKMVVPEDLDSVCTTCKNMVQQARDQLESNQTQEDLKAVFEGSCALIYIKPIVKECDRLVDQFIPELVETLSSQMNPSVVCSVAGLCNSLHIDKLLEEYGNQTITKIPEPVVSLHNDEYTPNECSNCYTIAHHMEYKFGQTSRDNVLEKLLNICGEFSSFSDACSSIVLTNFEAIYTHLQSNFNAQNVCHLSGQCSDRFHVHENDTKTPDVEIRPLSRVGMVEIGDDLPCKLCEQLVNHLKDLLVANTTEAEFSQVLHGLCKQTKSFAAECASIVDNYYPEIYSYLTNELNSNAICVMGGICPAPGKKSQQIRPLIHEASGKIASERVTKQNIDQNDFKVNAMQLPLERLTVPFAGSLLIDDKYCSTCEFVLDYIQKNVRNLKDRDEIQLVLKEMSIGFPNMEGQAEDENFLIKYKAALTELILQGKDFSEICRLVAVCPTNEQMNAWASIPADFTEKLSVEDKPNCPLCLFAVTKLYDIVKDEKTEENLENALDKLCKVLPKSINNQCIDFVKVHSKQLIDLLQKDLPPQEVCAYLKICDASKQVNNKQSLSFEDKIVAVPQNDVQGRQACALCEYVLHYIQQAITDPKAEDQVKQALDKVCFKLPESVQNNCIEFVNTYGDALVAVLVEQIDPSQVCPMIHICPSEELLKSWKQHPKEIVVHGEIEDKPNCPLCLFGVTQLYNLIKDNKTEASIQAALDKLCVHLPQNLNGQCETLVTTYSKQIIQLILSELTPQEVCVYLKLCDNNEKPEPEIISFFPLDKDGEIMTNEIPDYPMYEVNTPIVGDLECTVCEEVMKYLEKAMSSPKSKNEIEHIVHSVCNHLPSKMSQKCNTFVNDYAEVIIELLTQEVKPKAICTIIDLCKADNTPKLQDSVVECALCQDIVTNIEKLLNDPQTDETIHETLSKVCKYLPETERGKCTMIIKIYEQSIINIIKAHGDTRNICSKLSLCSSNDYLAMLYKPRPRRQADDKNLGTKPCTWGISYWCVDDKTAEECKATELCIKKGRLPPESTTASKVAADNREVASEAEQAVSKDAQSSS